MATGAIGRREMTPRRREFLVRDRRMAGDAFLCRPREVMDGMAFLAGDAPFGMYAGCVCLHGIGVTGGAIGLFQPVGVGKLFGIGMTGDTVRRGVVRLSVRVVTVETLVFPGRGKRDHEKEQDHEKIVSHRQALILIIPPENKQSKEPWHNFFRFLPINIVRFT